MRLRFPLSPVPRLAAVVVAVTVLVGCTDGAEPAPAIGDATSPASPIDLADRIAFGRWEAGEDRGLPPLMWTANTDGTDARPVGDQRGWYLEWSPDRTHLLFDYPDDGGNAQIATVRPDGSGFTQLTQATGFAGDAAYSSDGTVIAFSASPVRESDDDFSPELWVMDADGANPRALLPPAEGADYEPVFSPDGSKLVFLREIQGPDGLVSAIHVANADGSDVQAMTPFDDYVEHPRWSPDGATIIYNIETQQAAFDDPRNGIWTIPAAGGEPHQLLPTDDRFHVYKPDYSPDGSQILFGCMDRGDLNEDLCVMNSDGTGIQVIIETPAFENHGIWY